MSRQDNPEIFSSDESTIHPLKMKTLLSDSVVCRDVMRKNAFANVGTYDVIENAFALA
jgi:hypothetical protein